MRKITVCSALALLFVLITSHYSQAQASYTLSGYVKARSSGEDLIGAPVRVTALQLGALANSYGFYSLSLPEGRHTVIVTYLGYKDTSLTINMDADKSLNFYLEDQPASLGVVEINANSPRSQLERTQMSKVELQVEQVKKLPVLFGEVDILKTLQLLPGVQSAGEGMTGFFVRGGGPDQNLIILDEAVVYNASHLFGLFSVFNGDAIKNVELYKGGFPARFGGRLSSVIDINLKDGNNQKYAGTGGIGLIASRLTLEGPIVKDKSSFIISGRRTYFDVFTRLINKGNEGKAGYTNIPDYYFYDLNAKVNYELGKKDRLFLSGYFGRDVFGFNSNNFNFNFNWGNATTTARWNHIINPKLFVNTTATYTRYEYTIKNSLQQFALEIGSNIKDYALKTDLNYIPNARHSAGFGAAYTYHDFGIGRLQASSADNSLNINQDNREFGTEMGIYGSDDWEISKKWKVHAGLRLSGFENDTFYYGLEPRLSARYKLSDKASLKGSYTGMKQYIQLVSNSAASLPTDIWYPSNKRVQPQFAQQVASGVTFLLLGEKLVLSDEVYYKWMNNQIDFKDGAQLFLNKELDQEFVFGRGWAYGNEIFLQKQQGRLTGWIAYTLSWTYRQFDAINYGETFHPKYDQRHNLNIVASYEVTNRLTASATFVFGNGTNTTLPVAWTYFNDVNGSAPLIFPVNDKRNNVKLAPYHRMDLAIVYKFKPKWGTSDLTLSVYNIYNRRNPYLLYIDQTVPDASSGLGLPQGATARQISLFPIIPSLTYNFKF